MHTHCILSQRTESGFQSKHIFLRGGREAVDTGNTGRIGGGGTRHLNLNSSTCRNSSSLFLLYPESQAGTSRELHYCPSLLPFGGLCNLDHCSSSQREGPSAKTLQVFGTAPSTGK